MREKRFEFGAFVSVDDISVRRGSDGLKEGAAELNSALEPLFRDAATVLHNVYSRAVKVGVGVNGRFDGIVLVHFKDPVTLR